MRRAEWKAAHGGSNSMESTQRRSRRWSDRTRSRIALVVLALPLLLGSAADADERHASLLGVEATPCPLRLLAGEHACPGCGLTRGTALAVQGSWQRSFGVHPGGALVALLCAAGLAVHAHILLRRERRPAHERLLRAGQRTFVVGLLAAWVVRLIA